MRVDLLAASSVVPKMRTPIGEPRDVRLMRLRIGGLSLTAPDIDGVNQHVVGDVLELRDPQSLRGGLADPAASQFLAPEPFIESDAPEIVAEAAAAVRGVNGTGAQAEALTRYVNALLDKKPTVSLPSAREVLRTKVGDCNEHTALFVAMARALGIPARISVGLVYIHGAFYYHAWPEVYVDESRLATRSDAALPRVRPSSRNLWLPVDPTLNQFPADATHLRLARGGLDKQAAIIPLIGRLTIDVVGLELAPNSTPILVGRAPADLGGLAIPIPGRESACCACREGAR
jgi:transglutaminase-like putative cysteine protease